MALSCSPLHQPLAPPEHNHSRSASLKVFNSASVRKTGIVYQSVRFQFLTRIARPAPACYYSRFNLNFAATANFGSVTSLCSVSYGASFQSHCLSSFYFRQIRSISHCLRISYAIACIAISCEGSNLRLLNSLSISQFQLRT